LILVYIPDAMTVRLFNPLRISYAATWFDPVSGEKNAKSIVSNHSPMVFVQNEKHDRILILQKQQ
jgi:hypothetical protein